MEILHHSNNNFLHCFQRSKVFRAFCQPNQHVRCRKQILTKVYFTVLMFLQDSENSSLKYIEDNQTFWRVEPTDLRLDPHYVEYYLIYSNFIINSLLPFAILIILNYFICKRVSQSLLKNNNTVIKLMSFHSGLLYTNIIRLERV